MLGFLSQMARALSTPWRVIRDDWRSQQATYPNLRFVKTDEQIRYERDRCVDFRTGKPQVPPNPFPNR